ncbi:hypothetical protein D3C80_1852170 [compost metagenome]
MLIPRLQEFIHGQEITLRKTVAGKGDLAVVLVKSLCIVEPQRTAFVASLVRDFSTGVGNIRRNNPKLVQVSTYARGHRGVTISHQVATIYRPIAVNSPG